MPNNTGSAYFDSSSSQIDASKKALLDSVASAGTAGKAAFDAAQAQAAQAKQDAVARAAQRAALFGAGGNDQTFLGAYDNRMNQGDVNRTNFESGLAQTQASGDSYLEKARGAIPVLQAINSNKISQQEAAMRAAIAAAQAKAEAAAQAQAQKDAAAEARAEKASARADARAQASSDRADARAQATADRAAAKADQPTINGLLGAAAQQKKGTIDALNTKITGLQAPPVQTPFGPVGGTNSGKYQYGGNITLPVTQGQLTQTQNTPLDQWALSIGQSLGMPPAKLAELFSPQQQASMANAQQTTAKLNATPDEKYLMTIPGVDSKTAHTIATNKDYNDARDTAMQMLAKPDITPDNWNKMIQRWASVFNVGGSGTRHDRTFNALFTEFSPLFNARFSADSKTQAAG
jgi:hypothetical protein